MFRLRSVELMDLTEAYEVLNKYFPERTLVELHRKKKFDDSISDSIEKLKFNASLLRKEARTRNDKKEAEVRRMYEAARILENTSRTDFWLN